MQVALSCSIMGAKLAIGKRQIGKTLALGVAISKLSCKKEDENLVSTVQIYE